MEQDKKNQTGAPSSDTTSALFVSARKKQLEQQEAERRAKEKEDQRLAAEAEVRRLEREVEERKRKAEEDAAEQKRQAEEETRRIAEEARAKKAEAAVNPDAVLGASAARPQGVKPPGVKLPGAAAAGVPASSSGGVATAQKPAMDKKMMIIIGGAVGAVLIIVIVIFAMMRGGGSKPSESNALDILNEYDIAYYMDNGADVWYGAFDDAARVQTAEHLLGALDALGEKVPGFDKGSLASAINDIYDADRSPSMWNALCTVTGVDGSQYIDMLSPGSSGNQASDGQQESAPDGGAKTYGSLPDGFNRFTSTNGLTMGCPGNWKISDTNGGFSRPVVEITAPGNGFMYVINYADEGKNLSGQDVYDNYVDQVIPLAKLEQKNITSATDVKYEKFDGMEEYYQVVEYAGGLNLYVSVIRLNDAAGNIQAVFIVYPANDSSIGDTMSTIMESIEVA